MLSPRKKLLKKLDDAWSLAVREPCKCELCSKEGDIGSFDAHHIRGRGHYPTRWDLDNGACLCKGCHRFKVHMDTFTAGVLIDKLKVKRGKNWYKDLKKKSYQVAKYTNKQLEEIHEYLLKEIYEHLQD